MAVSFKASLGWLLLILGGTWVLGGCTAVRPLVTTYSGGFEDHSPYREEVNRWTRTGELYNQLDTVALVNVLYESWPVREAYAKAQARAQLLTGPETREKLKFEREQSERFEDFLVALYTGRDAWNDLDQSDSVWSLYLIYASGVRLQPYQIEPYTPDPAVKARFYSFMSPWMKIYRVRFLKPAPSPGGVTLRDYRGPRRLVLTGFLGEIVLSWKDGGGATSSAGGA